MVPRDLPKTGLGLGGGGVNGAILMHNADGKLCVVIDGGRSNLVMGGAGSQGDVALLNAKGGETVHIDGGQGNMILGGNGHDGDVVLRTSDGTARVHVEGHGGSMRAMDASGKVTIEISGEKGTIQVRGRNVRAADYVLERGYDLPSLKKVAAFIRKNGHLPGIEPGDVVEAEGIDLAGFTMQLLAKIEELTLYTLDQEERIAALEARIARKH